MSLKDILVHVGISKHRGQSIDVAIRLAQTFDGHLSALYTMPNVYIPSYVDGQLTTEIIAAQREDFAEQRGKVRRDFEERARKHGVKAEWREAEGEAPATAALHARHADLTVVGQLDPDESLPAPELALPERVLLEIRPARSHGALCRRVRRHRPARGSSPGTQAPRPREPSTTRFRC